VKDKISSEKMRETNISSAEMKNLTDEWERLELNNFIRALRPKSFREGKKSFDECVATGKL